MKKNLLLFCCLFISFIGKAQDCKYDRNDYDKFTKQRKVEKEIKVSGAALDADNRLKLKFCKYDTLSFFRITLIKRSSMVVGTSDELIFLFDDQQTVIAHPTSIYSSEFSSSMEYSILNATYIFNDPQAEQKFKSNKLTSVRIEFNQVYDDIEIKSKFQEDIASAAKCVY